MFSSQLSKVAVGMFFQNKDAIDSLCKVILSMTINQEKQNSDIQSKASLDNIVQL
jgi:hypothetical protein